MKKKNSTEFVLSEQEKEFLRSYREHLRFQRAVKILLDVGGGYGSAGDVGDIREGLKRRANA